MLGLEIRVELRVGRLDAEVGEKPADERRILELLERAGLGEERLVRLAEVRRDALVAGEVGAADRLEPGTVSSFEQRVVPLPLHQSVAPVEEDRAQHDG